MAELAFERLHKPKVKARRAADVLERAVRAPDPGEPLRPALRWDLEQKFGRDLSHIRVHSSSEANQAAVAAGAVAFTRGAHIFLASPQGAGDIRLLSHEMTHVVQQGAAPPLRLAARPASARSDAPASATRAPTVAAAVRAAGGIPASAPVSHLASSLAPAAATAGPAPAVQRQGIDVLGALESAGSAVGSRVRSGARVVAEGAGNLLELGREGLIALARRVAPRLVALFEGGGIRSFLRNLIARGVTALINNVLVPIRSALDIERIVAGFGEASSALSEARTSLEQDICEHVPRAVRRIAAFFTEKFGPLVEWFQGMAAQVSEKFNALWDKIRAPVVEWLREAGGELWQNLQGFIADVRSAIRSAREALGEGWNTVKSWLGVEAEDGESEGGGLWNWIRNKATEVGGAISDTIRPVLGPLRQSAGVLLLIVPGGQIFGVMLLWPEIRQAFDWLSQQWNDLGLVPRAREFWARQLLPRLMSGAERIGLALVNAAQWLVDLLDRVGNAVARAASSRLQGILEPINMLVDFAQETFNRVINWARSRLRWAAQNMRLVLAKLIEVGRRILDGLMTLISVAVNPFGIAGFVTGTIWRLIPDCLKAPIIDFILDLLVRVLRAIPPMAQLGLLWPFIRAGLLGFFERVRIYTTERKVNVSNKMARIISGMSVTFTIGYLRGIALGLWDLIAGPFQALAALFELPTLIQNFLSNLGLRLCNLIESIRCFAATLAGRVFGGLDSILSTFSDLLAEPGRIVDLIRCAIEGALAATERIGGQLADRMMAIFEGAEDAMGEMLGRITASVIGNALITYFTLGIGTAVSTAGQIAGILRTVGRALRTVLDMLRRFLRPMLRFIRTFAARFARSVASAARGTLSRMGGVFRRIFGWFGRLMRRIFRGLRRFRPTAAERTQFFRFGQTLRMRLRGHPTGMRRSAVRQVFSSTLRGFRRVAKWPSFITKHGPNWRLWSRLTKTFRPRIVARVLLDRDTRFRSGRREVKRRLRSLRDSEVNQAGIEREVRPVQRRFRFSSITVRPEGEEGGWQVHGAMSPNGRVARADNTANLHTGSRTDPIPLYWYKDLNDYPGQITLRSNNVPRQIARGSTARITVNGVTRLIGTTNFVRQQELLTRGTISRRTGVPQREFREFLADAGYNLTGKDADHVQDLGFGGFDRISNLWPLSASVNRRGWLWYWTVFSYKKRPGKKSRVPLMFMRGKVFRVVDFRYPHPSRAGYR